MATELGGSQLSNLMETLPGIASVLRSPVADAIVGLVRASARLQEFNVADAEELVKYATRRGLMQSDEGEQLLADAHGAVQKRLERAAAKAAPTAVPASEKVEKKPVVAPAAPVVKAAPAAAAAPKPTAAPKVVAPAAKPVVAKPAAAVAKAPAPKAPASKAAAPKPAKAPVAAKPAGKKKAATPQPVATKRPVAKKAAKRR